MNNKLLSIIAVFIGLVLPIKMQAQVAADELYAPEFNFEGDNLVMTCETQGAIIYYSMSEFTNDDEAYDLADNMEVNEYTGTAYTEPIPVTKNVVIKAIAKMPQMQGGSDYKVLIYNYTSWKQLLEAIDYGTDVLNRAQNNPNVSDDLKDQLKWAVEEGQMIYGHRGEMPDSHEAEHFTEEILQIAHEIEELLDPTQTDPEPYAVLSDSNKVLTFYYDEKKAERNGMSVGTITYTYDQEQGSLLDSGWFEQRENITTVVFDASFANCTTITNTSYWFYGMTNLHTIVDIGNLNTLNVTNMSWMFYRCSSLENIDLNGFHPNNLTQATDMFQDCTSLKTIDVSGIDFSHAIAIDGMFEGCSSLTSIDVSNINTSQVWNMSRLFEGCSSVPVLDLSSFNTENNQVFSTIFKDCTNLKTIIVDNDWNTDNIRIDLSDDIFENCTSLVGGAGTHYDPNHTDYTYAHIDGGTANPGYFTRSGDEPWVEPDPDVLLTGKINNYWYDATGHDPNGDEAIIFTIPENPQEGIVWEYNVLTTFIQNQLAFTTIDGEAINNISGEIMFESKGNMIAIDDGMRLIYENGNEQGEIAMIDPGSGMIRIFGNEITLRLLNDPNAEFMALPLCVKAYRNGKEATVTNGSFTLLVNAIHEPEPYAVLSQDNTVLTFYYDTNRNQRNGMSVGPFDSNGDRGWNGNHRNITTVVFDASFANCTTLTSTAYWFYGCEALTTITNFSNLKTDNVTDINTMFADCHSLTSIDLSVLNLSNVTNMRQLFEDCRTLENINFTGVNTENVTNMSDMFLNCHNLRSVDLSSFNTSKVTNMEYMFSRCENLVTIYVSEDWTTASVTNGEQMFNRCTSLIGGAGTTYDENHTDDSYAHIDEGTANPGYLTLSGDEPWTEPETEPYAVLSDNNTRLTFYYDENRSAYPESISIESEFWREYNSSITTVTFDESFANYTSLTSTSGWFRNFTVMTDVLGLSNLKTDSVTDMSNMFYNCFSVQELDLSGFNTEMVTDIEQMFFGCSSLMNINISNFNTSNVTSRNWLFSGCSSLASIQAGSANIPAEEYANVANPNLLVYVNEPSLAPEGIQNVVINGRAQEIILTDVTEGNNNWNCPEPFTAEKISYTRNFKQQTEVGISRGWESIALPFTVQTITHEVQGQIIPFGAQGNGKYFWLRGYSPEGLQRATVLEANTPYVISMPNNTVVYPYEYNLNGRVTFSAENTIVPATPEMDEMTITRGNITMSPIFRFVPQHERIYAINVGQPLDRYAEGSVFTRELREVRPFEAITIHDADINGARPRFIRIAAQPKYDITGIKTIENDSVEGPWYSLDGLQLQSQPQKKGVYIQNGKKVVIK